MATELRMPLDRWFEEKVRRLNDRVERVVDEMVEEGQDRVQTRIENSGTGQTWSRTYYRRGGGPRKGSFGGRVWSGEMRADVEQETHRGDDFIQGSFGWIHNYEDYYGFQEGGFDHVWAGRHIKGMFAMADAADWAEVEFKRRIRGAVREF